MQAQDTQTVRDCQDQRFIEIRQETRLLVASFPSDDQGVHPAGDLPHDTEFCDSEG